MAAGDIALWADVSATILRPIGRLVAVGVQSIPDNVQAALVWTAEDWDSHNFHSTVTNTSRVTPTVPGFYRVTGTYFTSALANGTTIDVNVRTNGATNLAPAGRIGGAAGHAVAAGVFGGGQVFAAACTAQVSVNGTTDYFELVVRQNSDAADDTNQSAQFSSVLEWEFLRPPL